MDKRGPTPRRRSDKQRALIRAQLLDGSPASSLPKTLGAEATARWLATLGLAHAPEWYVEIGLTSPEQTHLDIDIYPQEWGYVFLHDDKMSWIRVTDIAFAHTRDDFHLLERTPDLLAIGVLITELERRFDVSFARDRADIRTNIANGDAIVRAWLGVASRP